MSTETAVAPQWVAIYLGRAVTHSSKEEAERLSTPDRLALLSVAFDPKELSNHDLCLALEEMRRRGWAVAAYDVDDVDALISDDVDPAPTDEEIRAWLKDNQDDLQDSMCAAMHEAINAEWNRRDDG
jgi:glutamate/tyrosine decarboxylase-like PLP-dependent enzyme